ncbi:hypothetical protein [Pelagimonas varians]|uniref:hypothetical protein n=1 Tax=Pelagimonas varians TaxID=696760 RepID=UPI000BEF1758|nr:hypothetical protein [Pelagimonas varians]
MKEPPPEKPAPDAVLKNAGHLSRDHARMTDCDIPSNLAVLARRHSAAMGRAFWPFATPWIGSMFRPPLGLSSRSA